MSMNARLAAILALGALPLGAQQDAPRKDPQEKRTDAVRRLYEKDRAGAGDACRLILALVKDAPAEGDFEAVRKEAVERGLLDAGWELAENAPVTKGTVAYMLVKALGIKGGLTMSVLGPTRRYAFRECVYLRLISGGTPGEYMTGRELIDVLSAAELYKQAGSLDAERK
jgi:hypothetical protein